MCSVISFAMQGMAATHASPTTLSVCDPLEGDFTGLNGKTGERQQHAGVCLRPGERDEHGRHADVPDYEHLLRGEDGGGGRQCGGGGCAGIGAMVGGEWGAHLLSIRCGFFLMAVRRCPKMSPLSCPS